MSEFDLAVVNGTLVDETGSRPADVGIRGGLVAAVAERGGLSSAARTIEAQHKWILPGFIDAHFHCRAPDHPEREDFASGTMAAAAGGVTTVLEMPVADLGVTTVRRFEARRALAERDCYVDFGLFAGCGSLSEVEVLALADAGAIAFKIFTHSPLPSRQIAFEGLWLTENSEILRALHLVRGTGLPCAFHTEDESLLRFYDERYKHLPDSADRYALSRPAVVEAMAVARISVLAEESKARAHVVHVASRWALDVIRVARARGVRLTAETCPHYMFFTLDDFRELGSAAKVAPPLRTLDDAQALIDGIGDGALDIICSDHAPFIPADRDQVGMMAAPSGLPSVEIFAQLALDAVLRGQLDLRTVVRALTAGPARVYGLFPSKGLLASGSDADFVLYDPTATSAVETAQWFSRSRESAGLFEGKTIHGKVTHTFVRGHPVFAQGEVVGNAGWGQMVSSTRQR
ncbi:MAG: dihydroorotase family protein [Candidatus Dormiibacterota bacterium]